MYLPPASSTTFWIFGLSAAAQRGCWKLFHDTPTVHWAVWLCTGVAVAAGCDAGWLAGCDAGWLGGVVVPVLPHAAVAISSAHAPMAKRL